MTNKRTEELLKWDAEHILHALGTVGQNLGWPPFIEAQGVWIRDTESREYIDITSQLANVNLGHNRKDIAKAAKDQLDRMMFASTLRGYANVPSIELSQKLAQVVPNGLEHFLYTLTGSDADDSAFKIANLYYKVKGERRFKIISLFNSYHGTLRGTGGATGISKGIFAECPPCGSHIHIPHYFCYRCAFHKEYPSCGLECAEFLDYTIENEGADSVACFIIEPELGPGGFISPPLEYLPKVREICSKHGVLLIADEVMTGFGRTGKMFAVENGKIIPDIMTISKGITSGYLPMGAVAISEQIFDTLKGQFLSSGSTESGNPICCAVASKVLDIYQEENILAHVTEVSKYARERFEREFLPLPHIGTLTGWGLMLGLDIIVDKESKEIPLDVATIVQQRGLEHGIYLRVWGNRLCFGPPLIITKEEIDIALDRLFPIIAEFEIS